MNRKDYLDIFEKYIQRRASSEEIDLLISYINNDRQLNTWLEEQIMNSSSNVNVELKIRMLNNIRSQADIPLVKKPITKPEHYPNYPFRWIVNVAAILFPIVMVFSIYLYLKAQNMDSLEISAGLGEKANVTLPDGSKVSINSDSRLIYFNDYNKKDRYLRLTGEAYFDVKANPSKPFIVECSDLKVEVIGTVFGVNSYEDKNTTSVVLNSGKVKLTTQTETITMEPNDRIIYDKKTREIQKVSTQATDYTDWRFNRLRFDNESLDDIVKTIRRTHNIDIVFNDPEIAKMRFTGTIDNTNINSALNTLVLTSPVKYRMENGVIYLYKDVKKQQHFN